MEIWRFIDNYKSKYGRYRVSNLGRVKNGLGRVLYYHQNQKGYLLVEMINDERKKKRVLVHRLVAKAFIPNPDLLPQVNHINGKKTNNTVSNLEWCTNLQNYRHARLNGLFVKMKKGGDNPCSHLTNEQAAEIRAIKLPPNGGLITRQHLAERYGVSIHVIKDIRHGKSYRNA